MYIQVNGITNKKYLIVLQNIANLFFENKTVTFEDVSNKFIKFEVIQDEIDNEIIIEGRLTYVKKTQKKFKKSYRTQKDLYSEQFYRKSILRLFVKMLETITGQVQPWGTLTGIRPTKLYHQKMQLGLSHEKIAEQLADDCLIIPEKITLLKNIVTRQVEVIPDLYELKDEVSIYIGIPFCPTKCAYCTFPAYAIKGREKSVQSFLNYVHEEIIAIGNWLKENDIKVTTIYFGGGTPTSISAEQMDALYKTVSEYIPNFNLVREITVEAGRPDTITPEKLAVLNKWKIDRISINPQTYKNETLRAIGRHHSVEETISKFKLARSLNINNINMDLIIGLPGEKLSDFNNSLLETGKLQPESITVHTLSYKRASEMTQNKLKYEVASNEEVLEMMNSAKSWMENNDYEPYYLYRQKNILGNLENIGYALSGKESLYNIIIMEEQQTIIGLGCGAASKFVKPTTGEITRYANSKQPEAYEMNFDAHVNKKIEILSALFK